jgi:hypothetical protein
MKILKEYLNVEENNDTLISIAIYDKKNENVIQFIEDQLEKSKKINDPVKKNKINNRLFNFIKYLRDSYLEDDIISYIFLINDKIIKYPLNNNEIIVAKTYNLLNIFIKYDTVFYIEYFIDFFYNFNFIYTIKLNKNDASVIKMNKNKEKELNNYKSINEQKLTEMIDNIRKDDYKELLIIYGKSPILSKFDDKIKNILLVNNFANREELFILYENDLMKNNHLLLKNKLDAINNEKTNLDLYIFGKLKFEFKEAIESYSIKELYIEDKKIEKLKSFVDETFLNFKIIPIKSLDDGDIAYNFIKNYNGIMGIKYY